MKAVVSTARKKVGSVEGLLRLHYFPENTRRLRGDSAHARENNLGWNLCLNMKKNASSAYQCMMSDVQLFSWTKKLHIVPVSQSQWESSKNAVKAFSLAESPNIGKDTWRPNVFSSKMLYSRNSKIILLSHWTDDEGKQPFSNQKRPI